MNEQTTGRPPINPTVAGITKRLKAGESFSTEEVMQFMTDANLIPDLLAALEVGAIAEQKEAFELVLDLGHPILPAAGDIPARPGPYIDNQHVVRFLVNLLGSSDEELRNGACVALVRQVPDTLIRNHTREILQHVQRHPEIDDAVLLLGKTGADAALTLIRNFKDLREASVEGTRAALARLGDRTAENELIEAFKRAERPSQQIEAAHRLGYVATLRAVLTLAREIRTDKVYTWQMQSQRSMRVHIIEALHLAFLTEPVFFPPLFKPTDDSYYEKLEAWITKQLGVTLDRPRPPFLYEEDAPVIPSEEPG